MWEKVVLNLVSNAFKFTLEGEIRVGLQRVDSCRGAHRAGHRQRNPAGRTAVRVRPVPPRDRNARTHARGHRHRPGSGPRAGQAARRHRVAQTANSSAAARSPSPCRSGRRISRAEGPTARRRRHNRAWSRDAFVEEAMRWLPGFEAADELSAFMTGTSGRPIHSGRSLSTFAPRTDPARRRQRGHAGVRSPPAGARVGRRSGDERP